MSAPVPVPVAVVGMSCRLPGGIHTPQDLWRALLQGRDLITGHDRGQGREHVLPAGILEPADRVFDAAHFGLSAAEAAALDPQQAMLLELADEAFQDAGYALAHWRGRRVGVWVGSSCLDQALVRLGPGRGGTMVDTAGALPSMLANRLSRHRLFDWRGPSESVDTACSASLVAFHRARQALVCGEVELAVVAGVNLLQVDTHTRMFRASGVLASDGRCRPFDQNAAGFVRAEGGGVVILQTLDQARQAGTGVRALVAASGTNCDGAGQPIGSPSARGQIDLLRRVYDSAGIDPHQVGYVEAHGTGTRAGDGAEARALGAVLGQGRASGQPLLVGSVKANLGHLEGAAGIVSLIKAVLCLEHGTVAPTPHHRTPLRVLARHGLKVPTTASPWPEIEGPRTGAVSAFGFGGTNAHVVLRQAPPPPQEAQTPMAGARPHLVPVSAGSTAALRDTAARWAQAVENQPALGLVAATAAHRRDHHTGARAALVASSPAEAAGALQALARSRPHPALAGPHTPSGQRPRVVFVYSGHGGHRPGMGHGLTRAEPVFAAKFAAARAALAPHLEDVPWDPHGDTPLEGLEVIQPAQWAWQVAATALLASWGITPEVVVGHSLGEVAAAHAAGILSIQDGARLVAARSRLLAQTVPAGGLLATALSADQAQALTAGRPRVGVAAHNGPASTVIAGPHPDLAELADQLEQEGVHARPVPAAPPAHSPLVQEAARALPGHLAGLAPGPGHTALWSSTTGKRANGTSLGPAYWGRQLRDPVLLHPVLHALARHKRPVLVVEIAPAPVLSAALAQTLAAAQDRYALCPPLVACATTDAEHTGLLHALAQLYARGLDPRWPTPPAQALPLPTRAWTRTPATAQAHAPTGLAEKLHATADPGRRRALITAAVTGLLTQMLARQDDAGPEPGPGTGLAELGAGSLALAHLHYQLGRLHPALAALPASQVGGARTVAQLIDHIDQALPAHQEPVP